MKPVARIGDRTIGVCSQHTTPITVGGTITGGFPTATASTMQIARIGDAVTADCGHTDIIIQGSPTFTVGNIGVARMGDAVGGLGTYVGTITGGDPNTTTP